jgi:uncharacterized protein (TIGR02145 family)
MLVSTDEATNILTNSADLPGMIVDLGNGATQHGHYYGKTDKASDNHTSLGQPNSITPFTSQVTSLEAGTMYYYVAYITDGQDIKYGKVKSFTTVTASAPTLTTAAITSVTSTGAVSGGDITGDGGAPVTARGVCWNSITAPTVGNNKTTDESGTGSFTSTLTGLTAGSTYFVRAYATNSAGTNYGNELTFTTTAASVPTVTTSSVSGINFNSGIGGGNVTSDGGSPVLAKGVCWSTATGPTINNSKTTDGTGTGSYGSPIEGLSPTTKYYVRAYATNIVGTAYGNEVSFTTGAAPVQLPAVTTASPGNITSISATSGGEVTSDGGATITARGVCWNTTGSPSADLLHTTDGSGTGPFTSAITALTPNTKYYVRAFAVNSVGTGYGSEYSFTTLSSSSAEITTSAVTSIAQTTATGGGNITSDGGSAVTTRGICWSLNQNPTLADVFTVNDYGTGIFSGQMTNLSPGRTYYVRAYATNSTGTAYGNQVSFLTASDIPKVSSSTVGTLTATTVELSSEVLDNNGSTTIDRGFCYNLFGSPTIGDDTVAETGGIGTFTLSLTGLTPNTNYYVRAFAINNVGTGYGAQVGFLTPTTAASLTTKAVTSITTTTASSGGVITSDGGSSILAKGVCYSTTPNPVIPTSAQTNEGTGPGIYTSALTGLLPGTTYYIRAYVISGYGTAYGNELSFMTDPISITDVEGNNYNVVRIGTQLWLKENLRVKKYNNLDAVNTTAPGVLDISSESSPNYFWSYKDALLELPVQLQPLVSGGAGAMTLAQCVSASIITATQLALFEDWAIKLKIGYTSGMTLLTISTTCTNLSNSIPLSYGLLYTWNVVNDSRKICPAGWHVPSDTEWTSLTTYLGGEAVGGGKLKETGTSYWMSPNSGATNETGFTALPGGYRKSDGMYIYYREKGIWLSTTEYSAENAWYRELTYDFSGIFRGVNFNERQGYSVRCIRD